MSRLRLGRVESRQNLAEQTADRLRDAIVSGHFSVGGRLGVVQLANRVGVSTMPVREALILLEHEGLVERLPRRGYRVADIKTTDIADIFLLHAFLAGALAARAAESATDSLIRQLRDFHRQTVATADAVPSKSAPSRIEKLNHEFHRTINRSVPAQRLRWFLRTTTRYVPPSFYQSVPGWVETTLEDHPLILDALERRDPISSRHLMEQHVLRGGRLVVNALNNGLDSQNKLLVAEHWS
jgi:DNA-binding GntR family transcriptional regulator